MWQVWQMKRWNEIRILFISLMILVILGMLYLCFQLSPYLKEFFLFLRAVFGPFLIAMMISYLLNPIVNMLSKRAVPRSFAVLLIYTLFLISIFVIILNTLPLLEQQMNELAEHLPKWNEQIKYMIDEYNDHSRDMLPESIQLAISNSLNRLEQGIGNGVGRLMDGIGNTINQLFLAFIIPFLAFYMMKDAQTLETGVKNLIPRSKRKEMLGLFHEIDQALGNYIRGQLLVCVVVSVFAYIGYWIIGLPYAFILAIVVGVFNIIPYLGPIFGAIPAVFVAFTVSIKMVIAVVVTNLIVQMLEGNIISPQIVGRTLHMHPLMIIFAVLVGGEIGGVLGLILAVPFFAVGKVIIEHLIGHYVHYRL